MIETNSDSSAEDIPPLVDTAKLPFLHTTRQRTPAQQRPQHIPTTNLESYTAKELVPFNHSQKQTGAARLRSATYLLSLTFTFLLFLIGAAAVPTSASVPPAARLHQDAGPLQYDEILSRLPPFETAAASELIDQSASSFAPAVLKRPPRLSEDITLATLLDRSSYPHAYHDDAKHLIEQLVALKQRRDSVNLQPSSSSFASRRSSLWLRQASTAVPSSTTTCASEDDDEGLTAGAKAGYGIIVPILVILSGMFAGLTLGYMSLDETQLQVLASTGSEKQKAYAKKILPIRKDGHLLLTTLLIANMITNETLPIVADPLFPSPVLAVVVSTILVIIFAELVPQSVCSRYGLEIGAYMAVPTRCIIFALWPVGYPVSRVLHWTLGPHHGIVYRRAELKELVTLHALSGGRGGDLKGDTVMMVGGALDLQEKIAKQAMTPIDDVFMLPYEAKLDYPTLECVVRSGHSRIPIYQELEVSVSATTGSGNTTPGRRAMPAFLSVLARKSTTSNSKRFNMSEEQQVALQNVEKRGHHLSPSDRSDANIPPRFGPIQMITVKRKKIIGTLLVKSCVLLDPDDAVPVSEMTINALPSVPHDEPLLNVLNAFQDGRSHMAIVTSASRLNDSAVVSKSSVPTPAARREPKLGGIDEEKALSDPHHGASRSTSSPSASSVTGGGEYRHKFMDFWKRRVSGDDTESEQEEPFAFPIADGKVNGESAFSTFPDIIGVITLEDVLEELIGEEIYDEYDPREDGGSAWNKLSPPSSPGETAKAKLLASDDTQPESAARPDKNGTYMKQAGAGTLKSSTPSVPTGQEESSFAVPRTLLGRLGLLPGTHKADSLPVPPTHKDVAASRSPSADDYVQASPTSLTPSISQAHQSNFKDDSISRSGDDYLSARSGMVNGRLAPGHRSVTYSAPSTAHGPAARARSLTPDDHRRPHLSGSGGQTASFGDHLLLRGRGLVGSASGCSGSFGALNSSGAGGEGVLIASSAAESPSASRNCTPKPNRFKSTPVAPPVIGSHLGSASSAPVRFLGRSDGDRDEKERQEMGQGPDGSGNGDRDRDGGMEAEVEAAPAPCPQQSGETTHSQTTEGVEIASSSSIRSTKERSLESSSGA